MKSVWVRTVIIGAFFALAACAKKEPCCVITIKPATELSIAFARENQHVGYTRSDIKRCFGEGVINKYGARIHVIEDTRKSEKGRYCHTAFLLQTEQNPKRFRMTPFSLDNWDVESCELKAMYCLRPDAAEKIAKKFNLTIDKSPIYRK